MIKKEMIAMLLAGGQGSRLGVLTAKVAKPAVSFGAKYRIIDFPLSNCINSGIDTVGVLTQYQPLRLNTHIGIGMPWDLDRNSGGVTILPPYTKESGSFKLTKSSRFFVVSENLPSEELRQTVRLLNSEFAAKKRPSKTPLPIVYGKLSQAQDGDIIIMHDGYESTVQATEQILKRLTNEGFKVVSVTELFNLKNREIPIHEKVYHCK